MAIDQQTPERARAPRRAAQPLQPFHGVITPGLCFASGHCVWLFNFSSTPTPIGAYNEAWLIGPDGERCLYTDPPEAGPYVETYHAFDRTVGATTTWDRVDEERVGVSVEGEDGTTLDVRADLGRSTGTRLLDAVTALTPRAVLRTSIGAMVSNFSLGQVLEANGLKVVGHTDTREPYRVESRSLRTVTDASATVNGDDLGELRPPGRPIEFGDAKVPNEPFFVFGALYLRPPTERG